MNERLAVEPPEHQPVLVVGIMDFNRHPFALSRAFFREFDLYMIARLIYTLFDSSKRTISLFCLLKNILGIRAAGQVTLPGASSFRLF